MNLLSCFKVRSCLGFFYVWKAFVSLKQNTFNLGYFCATPTALIVAVLKVKVQFCSRFRIFKIKFDSKTENQKEPSGYFLIESAFVSSWPVAQWDWHVVMAWEWQIMQSLTLGPLLHVGGCSLVTALVAHFGWKLQEGNKLPCFAFVVSGSFWGDGSSFSPSFLSGVFDLVGFIGAVWVFSSPLGKDVWPWGTKLSERCTFRNFDGDQELQVLA